jgi:hypothetical protein
MHDMPAGSASASAAGARVERIRCDGSAGRTEYAAVYQQHAALTGCANLLGHTSTPTPMGVFSLSQVDS